MKWSVVAGLLAVGLLSWATVGLWAEPAVKQPIEFPHKTHIEVGLECTTCHDRAEKDTVAGRPATALCLSCHAGGEGTAEIRKVQAFENGGEIPWKRVWRLPRHVFFSHRTHVTVAKVKCQTCHGPMETLAHPPPRPLIKLAMDDCIRCHERASAQTPPGLAPAARAPARSLSTDCNACHR